MKLGIIAAIKAGLNLLVSSSAIILIPYLNPGVIGHIIKSSLFQFLRVDQKVMDLDLIENSD